MKTVPPAKKDSEANEGVEKWHQYVDARFTAIALLVGAPESHNRNQFADVFEKVFNVEPGACTVPYIDRWRNYYKCWYDHQARGRHTAGARQ